MGDAQSAQRDGQSEAAEEQSAVEDPPSEDSVQDKVWFSADTDHNNII